MKRILFAAALLLAAATSAIAGVADPNPSGPSIALCQGGAAVALTGTVTETALATCTIPRKWMGANGRVSIRFLVSHTNSANNKTLKVYLNGTGGTAYLTQVNTTSATYRAEVTITNRGATNSQVGYVPGITAAPTKVTSTVDTTVAVPVVISGQLANTGETITLESYSVELTPSK